MGWNLIATENGPLRVALGRFDMSLGMTTYEAVHRQLRVDLPRSLVCVGGRRTVDPDRVLRYPAFPRLCTQAVFAPRVVQLSRVAAGAVPAPQCARASGAQRRADTHYPHMPTCSTRVPIPHHSALGTPRGHSSHPIQAHAATSQAHALAHLSGSDVRPEQLSRSSLARAVRSPSLRVSERQSHSAMRTHTLHTCLHAVHTSPFPTTAPSPHHFGPPATRSSPLPPHPRRPHLLTSRAAT